MQCHTFRIVSSRLTTSSPHHHGSNPPFIFTSSLLKTAYGFIFDTLHRFGIRLARFTSVLTCPSIFMCHSDYHSTLCLHLLAFAVSASTCFRAVLLAHQMQPPGAMGPPAPQGSRRGTRVRRRSNLSGWGRPPSAGLCLRIRIPAEAAARRRSLEAGPTLAPRQ